VEDRLFNLEQPIRKEKEREGGKENFLAVEVRKHRVWWKEGLTRLRNEQEEE